MAHFSTAASKAARFSCGVERAASKARYRKLKLVDLQREIAEYCHVILRHSHQPALPLFTPWAVVELKFEIINKTMPAEIRPGPTLSRYRSAIGGPTINSASDTLSSSPFLFLFGRSLLQPVDTVFQICRLSLFVFSFGPLFFYRLFAVTCWQNAY